MDTVGADDLIARAIKASGAVVEVDPQSFVAIVSRAERPLVVVAPAGLLANRYRYLTSYKGLAFHTQSPTRLPLKPGTEVVAAKRVWVP